MADISFQQGEKSKWAWLIIRLLPFRFPVEGVAEDLVETLQILTTDDGKVYLSGQVIV